MSYITYTPAQKQRLRELGALDTELRETFSNVEKRERAFNELAKELTRRNRDILRELHDKVKRPTLKLVEDQLVNAALSMGFLEVATQAIIPRIFIERMGIRRGDELWGQVFWLDERRCLRPMLAPNLYDIMGKLNRFWKPVRIFEVGSCFRKDTRGPLHLEEFTMFNLVELAPAEEPLKRLKNIIKTVMKKLGVAKYDLKPERSDIYGTTLDIYVNGVEVASAVAGPNPLDRNWSIVEPWAGVGLGVERLAMVTEKFNSIARVGRGLIYLNGARLDIE